MFNKLTSLIATVTVTLLMVSYQTNAMSAPVLRGVCGAVADAEEMVGNKAMQAGKVAAEIVMKPIAIAGGLKAAAVGTGMKVSGAAIKFVGAKIAKDGLLLETAGAGIKGAGLGVAAIGARPLAEKVVLAGQAAQKTVDTANEQANKFVKSVGDTTIQVDATLDSPLLGHHHKEVNVTHGLNTFMIQHGKGREANEVQNQETQQEQSSTIVESPQSALSNEIPVGQNEVSQGTSELSQKSKRAAKVDPEVAKATLTLLKEAKLEDCVARAICDLNCNPQGFGHDGKQVFMNMVRLQGASGFDQSETKYFHEAASMGRKYSGKCEQCSTHFHECKSKSSDLIKMASHIKLD